MVNSSGFMIVFVGKEPLREKIDFRLFDTDSRRHRAAPVAMSISPPPRRALPTLPPTKSAPRPPSKAAPLPPSRGLGALRGRPPPAPPRVPAPSPAPSPAAKGTLRRAPEAGARKRAPTIVPAALTLRAARERRKCASCGAADPEEFCAACGAGQSDKAKAEEEEKKKKSAAAELNALEQALSEAQKKICVDCYNYGFEAFCADCGGKMLNCDDDDDDDDNSDGKEETPKPAPVVTAPSKPSPAPPTKTAPKPLPKPAAVVSSPVPSPVVVVVAKPVSAAASCSSESLIAPDFGNKEKVMVIDIGTEFTRFGFSDDANSLLKIRSCVDGRASSLHNFHQVRGQIFPFDGSETAFANNDYLGDLIGKGLKLFNCSADIPLLITTNVAPNSDGVSEWIFSLFDGLVLDRVPPSLFMGYSPVLSLCCALNSVTPTGIAVEIGASSCSVVPVYSGVKVDHCCISSPFGGRMFEEFFRSRSAAKWESVRDRCFASLDFRADMTRHGFEAAAGSSSQQWRGWRVKNAALAEQRDGDGLGCERFLAVEAYFRPSLVPSLDFAPLQDMVRAAVTSLPCVPAEELLANVVLSGDGAIHFKGMDARLQLELSALFPEVSVRVRLAPTNSAWLGARLLACHSTFPQMTTNEREIGSISHMSHRFF